MGIMRPCPSISVFALLATITGWFTSAACVELIGTQLL